MAHYAVCDEKKMGKRVSRVSTTKTTAPTLTSGTRAMNGRAVPGTMMLENGEQEEGEGRAVDEH